MADHTEHGENSVNFNIDKRTCEVKLEDDVLTWKECGGKSSKLRNLKYEDIIGIRQNTKDGKFSVSVNYVSKKSVKWTAKKKLLVSSSSGDCEVLVTRVREKLDNIGTCSRPRRLLVFVNPDGGAKTGMKTYTGTVAPLFKLAGIDTELVVTKHEKHASEVLDTYDLSTVDGLVSVGGDGTFRQVLHGLMTRVARDEGKDINSPEMDWTSPPVRVGVIPCGTGQGIIVALTGTKSVTTAALHIVLGTRSDYNLFSVHNGGKLLSVGGLLAGYGLFGKVIHYTETHRSMGRARYPVAIAKTFLSVPETVECEVKYIPVPRNTESHNGKPNGDVPVESDEGSDAWKTVRDRYIGVNMFSAPFPWLDLPNEPSMNLNWLPADFTRTRLLKWASRAVKEKPDAMEVANVPNVECSAIRITRLGEGTTNVFNIDGDPYELTDDVIELRHIPKVLKTYGDQATLDARREKQEKKSSYKPG